MTRRRLPTRLGALTMLGLLAGCGGGGETPAAAVGAAPDPGPRLYRTHCAACHQADGAGIPGAQPPLTGSPLVAGAPEPLVRWVLFGTRSDAMRQQRYVVVMPQFAWLSDADAAAVLTYVRSNFGHSAAPISAADVAAVRAAPR